MAFHWMNLLMLSALGNSVIKVGFQAKRPFQIDSRVRPVHVSSATSFSFPSGHSMNAGANMTWACLQFKKRHIIFIAALIALLIGFSRLYLRVHWPVDVAAGLTLGLLIAFSYNWYIVKFPDYPEIPVLILGIIVAVGFRDSDSLKLLGTMAGGLSGYWLAEYKKNIKVHHFKTGGIYKLLLGVMFLIVLKTGLSGIMPAPLDPYRYAVIGFTLTYGWPVIFQKGLRLWEHRA